MRSWMWVAALVTISLFTAGSVAAEPRADPNNKALASGVWGGQHARMEVTAKGANLEFACATGQISGPLTVDNESRIHARGIYVRQGPGPSRYIDETEPNATFTGKIAGDKLQLEITVDGETEVHSYTLVRGQKTRLLTCK